MTNLESKWMTTNKSIAYVEDAAIQTSSRTAFDHD